MIRSKPFSARRCAAALSVLLSVPVLLTAPAGVLAEDLLQEDTGIRFPETITVERDGTAFTLTATGVGLREATIMKVNVYAVVSYVEEGTDLGDDPASALIGTGRARRIHMEFVRGVGPDDIAGAYRDGIKKNRGEDTAAFAADLETFLGWFREDIEKGSTITLTWLPGIGLIAEIGGAEAGVLDNEALAGALWSIWFGKKPVSKGMRKDLLSRVS